MSDSNGDGRVRMEKRGGYSGGLPASAVAPPPKTPSGTAGPPPAPKKSR